MYCTMVHLLWNKRERAHGNSLGKPSYSSTTLLQRPWMSRHRVYRWIYIVAGFDKMVALAMFSSHLAFANRGPSSMPTDGKHSLIMSLFTCGSRYVLEPSSGARCCSSWCHSKIVEATNWKPVDIDRMIASCLPAGHGTCPDLRVMQDVSNWCQ